MNQILDFCRTHNEGSVSFASVGSRLSSIECTLIYAETSMVNTRN